MSEDNKRDMWFFKTMEEYASIYGKDLMQLSYKALEESFLNFLTAKVQELFRDEDINCKDDLIMSWIGYANEYYNITDSPNDVSFVSVFILSEFFESTCDSIE
ncbi:MAG: hypothetical protein WCG21_01675 [Eubacteriales bacterium]